MTRPGSGWVALAVTIVLGALSLDGLALARIHPDDCLKVARREGWSRNCWVGARYDRDGHYTYGIQRLLKGRGFYEGELDGLWGPLTKEAIERFQNANGLRITGVVNDKTWAELRAKIIKRTVKRNRSGEVCDFYTDPILQHATRRAMFRRCGTPDEGPFEVRVSRRSWVRFGVRGP